MTTKGMIFLETSHPIVEEFFKDKYKSKDKPQPVDIRAADFDGVEYHIVTTAEKLERINFSVQMKYLNTIKPMGAQAVIDKLYGSMVASKPETGYDLTLKIDLKTLQGKKDLIKAFSEIRNNLMTAPFDKCFSALASGGASGVMPMIIPYRANESICLVPSSDRVLVVFSIDFSDEADRAIAKVFLQEFAEAQRHVSNAPAVTFSVHPPSDAEKIRGFKESKNCVGYISFQVFKSHVEGSKKDKVCTMFAGFRSYLHYHIKASKAHLHARMRLRVSILLKVLNRANPEVIEAELGGNKKPFARKV